MPGVKRFGLVLASCVWAWLGALSMASAGDGSPGMAGGWAGVSGGSGGAGGGEVAGEALPRRGVLGVWLTGSGVGGVAIGGVESGSAAERGGLEAGDVVLAVGGEGVASADDVVGTVRAAGAGAALRFRIDRGGEAREVTVRVGAPPAEDVPGAQVLYSHVAGLGGVRQRTIITVPERHPLQDGPMPGVLFVTGLGCDSVEGSAGAEPSGWMSLVRALARSGYVTLRVEKPGVGDSEGGPCAWVTFEAELAGERAALLQLRSLPQVDAGRVAIVGVGVGGMKAALLAGDGVSGGGAAAVVTIGTSPRGWYEVLCGTQRSALEVFGEDAVEVESYMERFHRAMAGVLFSGLSPGEVSAGDASLGEVFGDGVLTGLIAGRSAAYHRGLASAGVGRAWGCFGGRLLAVRGAYDWKSWASDQERLVSIVNGGGAGRVVVLEAPEMCHGLTLHDSAEAAAFEEGEGAPAEELHGAVVEWLGVAMRG